MTLHTASILSLRDRDGGRILMSDVMASVCHQFGSSPRDIKGPWRDPLTIRARLSYYYLCRKFTQKSCTEIARKIGRCDHSVVIKGIKSLCKNEGQYQPELSRCISELQRKSIPDPQPSVPRTAVAATGAVPQASAPVAPPISRVLP